MHEHASAHAFGPGMAALLALAVLALVVYALAAARQGRRGSRWSAWRSASFCVGMALVIVSLTPPVVAAGHGDIRLHMVQHLMLGMLGPIGIVMGAPVTLALRSLEPRRARQLVFFLRSAPIRWLSHPAVALVANIGGMAALYATPLFTRMSADPFLHVAVHAHFLIAGCVFSWAVAGPDPAPGRPSHATRLGVLFVAIAAHATLAKAMYAQSWPRHTGASAAHIEQAAQIMYYGGDLSEALLAVALFASWRRRDRRRGDRHLLAQAAKPDTLCT